MLASKKFDGILREIQASHLNFSIQLTPFSALISIRKSFVTDRSGAVILPENALHDKSHGSMVGDSPQNQLERNYNDLQKNYAKTVGDYTAALETIQTLEHELKIQQGYIFFKNAGAGGVGKIFVP